MVCLFLQITYKNSITQICLLLHSFLSFLLHLLMIYKLQDVIPQSVHQRVPCILGSTEDVMEAKSYYDKSEDLELKARCDARIRKQLRQFQTDYFGIFLREKIDSFIYYFYSVTPFLILGISYFIYLAYQSNKASYRYLVYGYLLLNIALFVLFFSSLAGLEVPRSYTFPN